MSESPVPETEGQPPQPGGRPREVREVETVAIRFAGDSGDGMQLTGSRFTASSALAGHDLATLPDYPSEIRAPVGTTYGVSGFQINFSSSDITTPGDQPDVLVAMNPAALKVNLGDLKRNGILIVNTGAFTANNLRKAGYEHNPLDDAELKQRYQVFEVDISRLTQLALADAGLSNREVDRCKNFFALGLMYWLYGRSMDHTLAWIEDKFRKNPTVANANAATLKAGYHYGETAEIFKSTFHVPAAKVRAGRYRNIAGNTATCLGLVTAARKMGLRLFLGAYPITPASDILHELSRLKHFGITTFQAEDEIAAIGSAIGASYGGSLGVTATSGPGLALKIEALGLAVMAELPLVVIDVQRGGPSTGLPTKTEQADLNMALFGRPSESPVVVLAARSPADCFGMALEASRIAVTHMTPVILLTDSFLANGSEPWAVPDPDSLPEIPVRFPTPADGPITPFQRDERFLARPWIRPGTPGMEYTLGGLEKADVTGYVSYDSLNHDRMVRLRAEKVARVALDIPPLAVEEGPDEGELLVLGWGSTWGSILQAVRNARKEGLPVSSAHLRYLNPLPANTGELLKRFRRVLIPEMNLGQLARVIRADYLVDAQSLTWIGARPFRVADIENRIHEMLGVPQ